MEPERWPATDREAQPAPAPIPFPSRRPIGPWVELAVAAAVQALCAWLGTAMGWKGPGKTAISTALWPFYLDTWFTQPVWTGRALLPLAAFALLWIPLRRFVRGEGDGLSLLVAVALGAHLVHLGCGIERHGLELGLTHTFSRVQEYWRDVGFVGGDFLARFPEVGRLSQHGATHPPGLTLLLAGVKALGFAKPAEAEFVCSLFAPLAAFPLYGATRRLVSEEVARFAVPLFLLACSVTVFAVLAMDTVTMFFAALSVYGLARALDGEWLGGIIWGVAYAAASLCTFLALLLALTYGPIIASRRRDLDHARWRALAAGPAGFLATYAILAVGFGYRPLHAFLACNQAFERSDNAFRSRSLALLGNPVAFLGALGLPLAGLCGRTIGGAAQRLAARRDVPIAALVVGAVLPPAVSTVLGMPRGEVEHIYLLFVPALVIGAAAAAKQWYRRGARWLTHVALPLAVAQSVLVEVLYDTYW